ncbi:general transcription factor II-I repeat domain-containing protein 2-like [Nothobranchius furzeri]|uniref:general transcription factor II-I repeat domain-containing protein 2-like n=1 Tax=Nothobranchius furzeri TaxID=105023 RepID=UPI003904BD2D
MEDIAGNLELQLQREVASFDFFSLDGSCDVRDTAQLLVFVRGITDFKLTEERAAMRWMRGTTTGSDLFTEGAGDGSQTVCGSCGGLHTAVRWLSLGKVLKRVWDSKAEIQDLCWISTLLLRRRTFQT